MVFDTMLKAPVLLLLNTYLSLSSCYLIPQIRNILLNSLIMKMFIDAGKKKNIYRKYQTPLIVANKTDIDY